MGSTTRWEMAATCSFFLLLSTLHCFLKRFICIYYYIQAYIHICMHIYIHTYIRYIQTCSHTYIHTNIKCWSLTFCCHCPFFCYSRHFLHIFIYIYTYACVPTCCARCQLTRTNSLVILCTKIFNMKLVCKPSTFSLL